MATNRAARTRTTRTTAPRSPAQGEAKRHYGPLSAQGIRGVFTTLAGFIDPRTELVYGSTYQLLVAVVLSAQSTDRGVNAATKHLFAVAPTPAAMVGLGVDGVSPYLRGINYYKTKARNVVALSQQLIELHQGEVPADRAALMSLPGVGQKTASVVLNTAFRQPVIAVDTHIHRVANRLGIAKTTTPEQTEAVLMARTPRTFLLDAHHYLILHGRYCCLARGPECWRCPVATLCTYPDKVPASPATANRPPRGRHMHRTRPEPGEAAHNDPAREA